MADFSSSLFLKRLKLYAMGLGLGLVASYFFFGDRYPTWLPGSRVLEDLERFELSYSPKALCEMDCINISKDDVQEILTGGDVNFSESDPRAKPCPSYLIEGETEAGLSLHVIVLRCDSTSKVLRAIDLNNRKDCGCD